MNKKTLFIIGGSILVLGITGYLLKDKLFTNKKINTDTDDSDISNTTNKPNDKFPLKIGSEGDNVKAFQVMVNKLLKHYNKQSRLVEDGVFGAKTKKAVDILKISYPLTAKAYLEFHEKTKII